MTKKKSTGSRKRSVPKYVQAIHELVDRIERLEAELGELALTIYISKEHPPKSDIGRWADALILPDIKERFKDVAFVDGILCRKKIIDKDTVEWVEVE